MLLLDFNAVIQGGVRVQQDPTVKRVQVSTKDLMAIVGFEALIRARQKTGGQLGFIADLATGQEQAKLITELNGEEFLHFIEGEPLAVDMAYQEFLKLSAGKKAGSLIKL